MENHEEYQERQTSEDGVKDHRGSIELSTITNLERTHAGWPSILSASKRPTTTLQEEDVPLVNLGGDTQRLQRAPEAARRRILERMCLFCICLALLSVLSHFSQDHFLASNGEKKPVLAFQERSGRKEFKILQITDIHLGEAENLEWGPRQDRNTWRALDAVLLAEAPIDLIVLGGDQLTANNCENNATAYYKQLGEFLSKYGVPWATIFGNHDDMAYETPSGERIAAKHSRRDLLEMDKRFPLSLTRAGPETIDGTSNYVLDILDASASALAAQVLLLDSGGGAISSAISDSQIAWVREQNFKSKVPAVAFQHIPTKAHTFVDDGSCQGLHDDGFDPVDYDGGIMEALSATNRFFFLGVGHDHGMGYCCPYHPSDLETKPTGDDHSKMHVCFGRHSGYGGYGRWERGCRVYELFYKVDPTLNTRTTTPAILWSSWVRMESGETVDRIIP